MTFDDKKYSPDELVFTSLSPDAIMTKLLERVASLAGLPTDVVRLNFLETGGCYSPEEKILPLDIPETDVLFKGMTSKISALESELVTLQAQIDQKRELLKNLRKALKELFLESQKVSSTAPEVLATLLEMGIGKDPGLVRVLSERCSNCALERYCIRKHSMSTIVKDLLGETPNGSSTVLN